MKNMTPSQWLGRFSKIAGGISFFIGAAVLLGWFLDNASPTGISPAQRAHKPPKLREAPARGCQSKHPGGPDTNRK